MRLGPVTRDHTAPQDQDEGRRRLRKGAALVALDIKRKGFYGEGLRANDMAQGHSERTLERFARGASATTAYFISPAACHRVMSNADRQRLGLPVDPDLDRDRKRTVDESNPKAATWPT